MKAATITLGQLQLRLNWRAVLVLGVGLAVLLRLGFWQLDRAAQKRQLLQQQEQLAQAEPVIFSELADAALGELKARRVQLQGHYQSGRHILVVNQRFRGMAGYEVITPFEANDGRLVLVGRGWVEAGLVSEQTALDVAGETELVGVFQHPPKQSFFKPQQLEPGTWPILLHHFDLESVLPHLTTVPVPYMLRLESGSAGLFQRHWPSVEIDPGVNTSYAAQWFGMAFLLLLVALLRGSNLPVLLGWKK